MRVAVARDPGDVAPLGEGDQAGALVDRGLPLGGGADADAEGLPAVLQRLAGDRADVVEQLDVLRGR